MPHRTDDQNEYNHSVVTKAKTYFRSSCDAYRNNIDRVEVRLAWVVCIRAMLRKIQSCEFQSVVFTQVGGQSGARLKVLPETNCVITMSKMERFARSRNFCANDPAAAVLVMKTSDIAEDSESAPVK